MEYSKIIGQISFACNSTIDVASFLTQQQANILEDYQSIENILPLYEVLISNIDDQIGSYSTTYGQPIPSTICVENNEYSMAMVLDNLKYARLWLRNTIWKELLVKALPYFPANL